MPLDKEELLRQNPDLAGPLDTYFRSLDELHEVAAGFVNCSQSEKQERETADCGNQRRLGDFVLLHEIGRGGMGVVYEAQQVSLNRRVALKILPFAAVLDSKQIARFKNEARAAAQLEHSNIVSVFAVGVERGVHYFAMQYVDGQPLDRAIAEMREAAGRRRNDLAQTPAGDATSAPEAIVDAVIAEDNFAAETACVRPTRTSMLVRQSDDRPEYFRTVVRLGIQAAGALHAAHEFGIVHRDVKPSNLLLDSDGKLWVTDFGLARFQTDATLTRTGDIIGTTRYMSPEQISGQNDLIDRRTDIYSLGATLYELLVLRPAFEDDDARTLLTRIQQDEPKRLRQLEPRIPRDLETVILKAMSKRRGERYRTAQRFADDLQRILDGRPTVARPPTLPQRVGRWAARRQRFVMAGAAVCLLALVGMVVSTVLIAREKNKAEQNFARAEQYFRDAREVVDHLGARLAEQLSEVPGATQVRRDLLRKTLQYYRGFAEQTKNDPALKTDLALTYSKIGTLASEVGSVEEAIEAHRSACELCKQLAAGEPTKREHERRLAVCQNNLGLALSQSGRTEDARQSFEAAIRLQQELLEGAGDNEQYLEDLALSYNNMGLLKGKTGDEAAATVSFEKAIEIQERLLVADADNADRLRNLAASLNNLATYSLEKSPARTIELYEKVLGYQQKASRACPRDLEYRSDVSLTYNNLGTAQMRAHQFSDAVRSYKQAVAAQRELVSLVPSNRAFQHRLAVDLNNLGLALYQLGQIADARQAFQQALALQEPLARQNPNDADLQSSLGGVYNNMGMVSERLTMGEEASASYAKAIEHQKRAQGQAPNVARYRTFLSKHYYNYGRVLRQLRRADEAAQVALARKLLWPNDPQRLLTVAEELALVVPLCAGSHHGKVSREQCAAYAIDTLEEAMSAGLTLPRDFDQNQAFAALKGDRRFAKLTENR